MYSIHSVYKVNRILYTLYTVYTVYIVYATCDLPNFMKDSDVDWLFYLALNQNQWYYDISPQPTKQTACNIFCYFALFQVSSNNNSLVGLNCFNTILETLYSKKRVHLDNTVLNSAIYLLYP